MIAKMMSMSLLAEGSYEPERSKERVFEGLRFVLTLTLLAVVLLYLSGDIALRIFGDAYSKNSFDVLRVLLIGCLPYAINVLYASAMMVKKNVKRVVAVYGCIAWVTVVLGYVLINLFGVVSVGYAWIVGNILGILYCCYTLR